MLIGGGWQAVADSATPVVSEFTVEPVVQETLLAASVPHALPAGQGSTCLADVQQVRSLALTVSGHPANDPSVVVQLRAAVRLRNDAVIGACAA